MARPLRVAVEDGWYHVFGRGLERRDIYRDERDREHFLALVQEAHEYDIESRLRSLRITNGAATVAAWSYGHNAMGLITAITSLNETIQYGYDAI